MTHVVHETRRSLCASPIFAFYVLATLAVVGIIGLITFDVINLGMSHFGDLSHRTHDVTYGFLFTTGVVGMLAQLRRPEKNVAGMLMALIPVAALGLTAALTSYAIVVQRNPLRYAAWLTVVAALVHPAGHGFFRSFNLARINWVMLALVGVAAVPLLSFASINLGLQRTVTDMHSLMGHYGFEAAFCFTVVAVGILASLRPVGWRLTAWVAGLLSALLGVTSILFPDPTSSLSLVWALAAIVWGVIFVAAAQLTRDADDPGLSGARGVTPKSASASAPRDLVHRP